MRCTIDSRFWTGRTGQAIKLKDPSVCIVAMYLMTSPHANSIGLYRLPIDYIIADTGLSDDKIRDAMKILHEEIDFCSYDEQSQMVFVHKMALHQIGKNFHENDKRVIGVRRQFEKIENFILKDKFFDAYQNVFYLDLKG